MDIGAAASLVMFAFALGYSVRALHALRVSRKRQHPRTACFRCDGTGCESDGLDIVREGCSEGEVQ
jgi:hypothetical protein